jgi:hypothetical protein
VEAHREAVRMHCRVHIMALQIATGPRVPGSEDRVCTPVPAAATASLHYLLPSAGVDGAGPAAPHRPPPHLTQARTLAVHTQPRRVVLPGHRLSPRTTGQCQLPHRSSTLSVAATHVGEHVLDLRFTGGRRLELTCVWVLGFG